MSGVQISPSPIEFSIGDGRRNDDRGKDVVPAILKSVGTIFLLNTGKLILHFYFFTFLGVECGRVWILATPLKLSKLIASFNSVTVKMRLNTLG